MVAKLRFLYTCIFSLKLLKFTFLVISLHKNSFTFCRLFRKNSIASASTYLVQMGFFLGLVIFFLYGVTKFYLIEIQLLIMSICNLNCSFSVNIKSELDKGAKS